MIKCSVLGHLGNDATVNVVNGRNVINFNCAHSEKYKDQNGVEVNKTTWVSCSYWSDKTGIAQYLKKGQMVYVEGQPDVKQYTANDGKQRVQLTLRVNSIHLCGGSGNQSNNNQSPQQTQSNDDINNPNTQDDLPF